MEQETLEEAALKNCEIITHDYYLIEKKLMFIAGAKWQAERMYSEEEPDYDKIKEALVELRKQPMSFVPDKIMYSEEEVLEILHSRMRYTLGEDYKEMTTIEWFEQFKKK
jgi:hypothetical protein